MPAFIEPRYSQHVLKEPDVFISEGGGCHNGSLEFTGSSLLQRDHMTYPARSFSVESVQLFLAARDSSIECCQDSLHALETPAGDTRTNARYDLQMEKCCKDLQVALAKQRQGAPPEAMDALRQFERQRGSHCGFDAACTLRNASSRGSLDTSIGDDQSQESDSSGEESGGDEAVDRMYAQEAVSRKIGIAREVSPKKSNGGVEHLAAREVQVYQDIMREKFDKLGQHASRPLCCTANPVAAVCDAVSRYHEVNEEIGEYYAMPGDRPSGGGLSHDQQERLGRYARCLAGAHVKQRERSQKPSPPVERAAPEKPKSLMSFFF